MINIHFSPYDPRRDTVLLARACGIGRKPVRFFERSATRLFEEGPKLWAASDRQSADLMVYTYGYDASPAMREFEAQARADGKPCLFFDASDNCRPYEPAYGTAYRCSLVHESQTPRRQAMPPPQCEDLLDHAGGALAVREKRPTPTVGFCGHVTPAWEQWLNTLRGQPDKAIGMRLRRLALTALRRGGGAGRVETNFVERRHYHGGALRATNPAEVERIRREFIDNVLGSDYTLCVRGTGNFSYRFYEALSAGRIPLLIDTGGGLPFEGRIDWPRHCVIVPVSHIRTTGDRLAEFHESLTPAQFADLQRANRALWEEWLNPLAFHRRVVQEAVQGRPHAAVKG